MEPEMENDVSDFYVHIIHDEGTQETKTMGPYTFNKAEKIADGAGINLDWDNWSIDVNQTQEPVEQ